MSRGRPSEQVEVDQVNMVVKNRFKWILLDTRIRYKINYGIMMLIKQVQLMDHWMVEQ